ncbi:MAG: aldo/keto reductase [Symbiobacteriaceae bacterium]|nr:aldo/keto reductase [Symbiobacteriaceae bacterium]
MQYVSLGNISSKVSRFGLGCMRLPQRTLEDGKRDIDDEAAIELIRYAIDHGVNYLDTAYAYGRSEEVLGKALQDGYREKVILVTKLPLSEKTQTKADLQALLDEELKRLQTDYIDVYMLHNLHKGTWRIAQSSGALDFLTEQKAKGVIRHPAFSVHERPDHLKELLNAYPWELIMVQYNYLDKFNQMGQEGVRLIASRGIPVVAMEPLHGGLLGLDVPQDVINAFGDFYPEANQAEKAFMWLYNQPEVAVVLSGSSSMEQLQDSLRIFAKAQTGVLTPEDELVYDRVRAVWSTKVKVPCTNCQYCLPCPSGVNIPEVFRLYNETERDASRAQRWLYQAILANSQEDATRCVGCKLCEPKCPQFIAIAEKLKEAHEGLVSRR